MVYVQDIDGKPMMPTTRHGKVRRLLKDKKAVVVNLCPFTIRLTYVTFDYKQEIVLGVDAGTKHVGLSATTKSKELYSSEVILRNDIVDLLSTRRELRRTRRNRLRYRKPRFDNRIKSKRPGWVAPSVKYKVDAHIRVIENICSILPISRIVIEVAQFDTQKIKNPEILGKEYQEGDQLEFWNTREYVLARDGHESYTSKIDHLAFEPLKKQESYLGKRKKRGLFQSSIGKLINADINGSIGIARKVIGDSFIGKIIDSGFVFNPIRVNTL